MPEIKVISPGAEKLTLSVPEAAKLSGIGKNYLYNLCHTPDFPVISIGNRFYIHRDKFLQWLDEQAQPKSGT